MEKKYVGVKYTMPRGGRGRGNTTGAGGKGNQGNQQPPPVNTPPQINPVGADNRGAFGGSLGGIATGAGIGFIGSQMFGGNDTALGSALDNLSEGVGTGIGAIGQGVGGATGSLGAGVGGAVGAVGGGVGSGIGALGQGAGGAINSVGGGLGDFMSYLPLVLAVGGVIVLMNMTSKGR